MFHAEEKSRDRKREERGNRMGEGEKKVVYGWRENMRDEEGSCTRQDGKRKPRENSRVGSG
jgi:hypothetical protein